MLNHEEYLRWKATRPKEIQAAMDRFPFGEYLLPSGEKMFLRSWKETEEGFGGLTFTPISPVEDYEGFSSPENPCFVCPEHLDAIELLEPYYKAN